MHYLIIFHNTRTSKPYLFFSSAFLSSYLIHPSLPLTVGYAYFDVFNQNARPQSLSLLSPSLDKSEDNAPVCLTFWYAYFGASDTTRLKVVRESYDRGADEEDQRYGGAIVVRGGARVGFIEPSGKLRVDIDEGIV